MARGKYERTPLTEARFKLTIAQRRIDKLLGLLAEAEHQKAELQTEVTELEKEEAPSN
ncbi:UNVERIFIED_ORG: hypothetical protein ABID57_003092 [Arthrobacter sp. UYEF1]